MLNKYNARSCVRQTTDQLERHATTAEHPTVFLNSRVMRATGMIKRKGLRVLDPTWHYGPRGSVRQYECPVCHRPMWCTVDEAHTPYMTCRQCENDTVEWLYQERHLPWLRTWTGLMDSCYDPLIQDPAGYAVHGVDKEWLDPFKFCRWCDAHLSRYAKMARESGRCVYIALKRNRGLWCKENATVDYELPRHKKYIRVWL